jgi:cob(I)alamin adenosyltransferase
VVKLTKIYTRGGDEGMTSLIGGARVSKHHIRLEAIGAVDACNATIGLVRHHTLEDADAMLERIQQDLFDLGADIATPLPQDKEQEGKALRIVAKQVKRLEKEIDHLNASLEPLTSFVLPGGSAASAYLHLARVEVRRAERTLTALADNEPVNAEALRYINRLSDHLFVLARHLNDNGINDVLWKPGANR